MAMNFSGLTILDIYGVERVPLEGEFTARTLADRFVAEWIPYMECHKCGKADYCKFAEPHPGNESKKREIKCGVAESAIRNFVEKTFSLATQIEQPARQAYLDGAFHFGKFVLEAEQSIGILIDREMLDWFGDYAPSVFGRLIHLRDTLNSLGQAFRQIPAMRSHRGLLLVEGWSEKAFLDKLRESHSSTFLEMLVECYDGRGNRKSKRIAMLLQKYIELGYTIYAQGDADGKPEEIFKGLVDSGHLKPDNTFVFRFDFETAVPLALLCRAMRRVGIPIAFRPTVLGEQLVSEPQSVNRLLKTCYGIDLEPRKMELAATIAEVMNGSAFAWWQDDDFMSTELGQFLRFIQKMA